MERAAAETPCAVALHTTWSGDARALARQLLPWLSYHAALGASRLYLLYEGDDPAVIDALAPAQRVELMLAGGRLAEPSEAADYAAYLDRHGGGGGSWHQLRGAYGRMIKQGEAPGGPEGIWGWAGFTAAMPPAARVRTVPNTRASPHPLPQPTAPRALSAWRATTASRGWRPSRRTSCCTRPATRASPSRPSSAARPPTCPRCAS
jgi:hypothetical protein